MTTEGDGLAQVGESALDVLERARRMAEERGIVADPEPEQAEPEEPTGGVLRCAICGAEIASVRIAWRKVVGYERPRKQGGTNAIRLRRPVDEYACEICVTRLRAGVDPAQGTLA